MKVINVAIPVSEVCSARHHINRYVSSLKDKRTPAPLGPTFPARFPWPPQIVPIGAAQFEIANGKETNGQLTAHTQYQSRKWPESVKAGQDRPDALDPPRWRCWE